MIHAIIPAAGRSRRMGQPKQLMDIAGMPMLLAVTEPLIACELIGHTVVVTNSLVASELNLDNTSVAVVLNDEPDAEMIDSIRQGTQELQRRYDLQVEDGILICPGDQPGLTSNEITACCAVFVDQPDRFVIAVHRGKRGHPLIFPASQIPFLMSQSCDGGLRDLVTENDDKVTAMEIPNPAVLRNVNTPDDYKRMLDN